MADHPPIKVLIVDDAAMIRRILSLGLGKDPAIEIMGTAASPEIAARMLQTKRPDVITLDIEMPGMDGVSFLKTYMPDRAIPTVVISSVTRRSAQVTVEALEAGAVDVISKPVVGSDTGLADMMVEIRRRVKAAAMARLRKLGEHVNHLPPSAETTSAKFNRDWVIAIGSSTGGVQALARILPDFPITSPPIVVTQHMPQGFTGSFARRLDDSCTVSVREARDGDELTPGVAYIAPGGDKHMTVVKHGRSYFISMVDGDPVCFSRPSVDVLFKSVAKATNGNCSAAVLTGMGRDGAQGLLEIRASGGRCVAQDETSSVVFGMPLAAWEAGAAEQLVPLDEIPVCLLDSVGARGKTAPAR